MPRRCPKSRLLALVSLLFLAAPGALIAAEVEVTYLRNEGFLIAAGEREVLIDALFGRGLAGYGAVPEAERRQLEKAAGRFAGVELVLASHHHPDHFDPVAVGRHLEANPRALFVSTEQAAERLRRGFDGFEAVADRVRGVWPAEGERVAIEHEGIGLTVLNLHHGKDRQPPVQNLGLLVEIAGLRLLHVGDTELSVEELRPYALGEEAIDVALLPSWFFTGERWRPLVAEIGAGHTVVMHLPVATAPRSYFGPSGDLEGLIEVVRRQAPGAWIPTEPMASRSFEPRR